MFKKEKKKKIEKNLFEMDFRWAADFDFSSVLLKKTLKIVKKMKKVAKKGNCHLTKPNIEGNKTVLDRKGGIRAKHAFRVFFKKKPHPMRQKRFWRSLS